MQTSVSKKSWTVRHWDSFLRRSGGVTTIRRLLKLADGSIFNEVEEHIVGVTTGEFFKLVDEQYPDKLGPFMKRAIRVSRMYNFFRRRIPSVVDSVLAYP